MSRSRQFLWSAVAIGLVALAHALLTWPIQPTVTVFAGGAALAFVAEVVAIQTGVLDHHIGPKLLGVPLYVLFGWTAIIYAALRVGLLVAEGLPAVLVAAVFATAYDLLVDHRGVADGHWTYTDDLPGPRHRGVPWWNYVGWFVLTCITGILAVSIV